MRAIAKFPNNKKPIVACFVGGSECVEAAKVLAELNIPMYDDPAKAMSAMGALREAAKFAHSCTSDAVGFKDVNQKRAREVIAAARADGRCALTELEAKEIFTAYGLPVAPSKLAHTEDEACSLAKQIGLPVVMKIVSPDILHKSDAGGVKVNIKTEADVRTAFQTIIKNAKSYRADAKIHGVLVQQMAPLGREVIVGSVKDPQFGPTVMFGLGGIFVEVLKDVTFRVAPICVECAKEMLPEIRAYKILQGVRGEKRLDQERLAEVIARVSHMVNDLGDEIIETDANPIMLYEEGKGLMVVDARIILK